MAQLVKNLPAMQETWVQSLSWEDAPKKGMTIHSSILAWRFPWTEEPGDYSLWDCKESDMNLYSLTNNVKLVQKKKQSRITKSFFFNLLR